ncbi:hypothetical protein ACIPRI_09560 [Variovorax sp. LARHSF232]
MVTSPLSALRQMLRGVRTHTLDDHSVGKLLGLATLVALAVAVAMVAVDPTRLASGSVYHFELSGSAEERAGILQVWSADGLLPRAVAFLVLEAALLAPAVLIGLLAFGERVHYLITLDQGVAQGPGSQATLQVFDLLALASFVLTLLSNALALALICGLVADPAWAQAMHLVGVAKIASWVLLAVFAVLWFAHWYFAVDPSDLAAGPRARMRADIADMLWRTKYAMAVLLVFGALVLVMDQTRDALLRQAVDPRDMHGPPWRSAWGLVITAAALWLLAYGSWLWARLILRLAMPGREGGSDASDRFAKWWCRILGALPFGLVGVAVAQTIRDQPAGTPAIGWLVAFLAIDGLLALLFLVAVAYRRRDTTMAYYSATINAKQARADMGALPLWVAWVPPALFLLSRFAGLIGWTPPLALAVVASGLAVWAGILGWVAYQSRRRAAPYLLGLFVLGALIGYFDLDESHRILAGVHPSGGTDFSALSQFLWTIALGLPCVALACWLYRRETPTRGVIWATVFALVAIGAVLKLRDGPPLPRALPERPTLEQAAVAWLKGLADAPPPGDAPFAVYIVSAEGGGIRSAYWSASVLSRMKALDPDFDKRTFSLSAVSGGALGIAVFRACDLEAKGSIRALNDCIDRFGATDLWTQLLGAALFEDALGSVLPTTLFCESPGCRLLGRSHWFEGLMETPVRHMASGLSAPAQGERRPHLFLTVTRVESGERWIQSDVAIDIGSFPGACDVLDMLDSDIRLSTASHNSSRFPYTNPVGALYGRACIRKTPDDVKPRLRARLQDGGYFDDSATSTSADIVRVLSRCLFGRCASTDPELPDKLEKLRTRLRPVVISIRNEDRFDAERTPPADDACNPPDARDPARPRDGGPLRLVPSLLSSPLTLYQTRTAHMRAADADLANDAAVLWERLALPAPGKATAPCGPFMHWVADAPVRRIDLLVDAVYPSGWVLSESAMKGIRRQIELRLPG